MTKQVSLEEFEAIFHSYKNMVFRLAYLTLGNVQEAEDVMQEVFIKVYHAKDSFNPDKGSFNSWLRRITVNHSISRRRRKSLPSLSLEKLNEEGSDLSEDHHRLPDELLIKRQESKRMQEALNSLDKKHRAILVLRYYEDLSYNEIARVMEVPLGTVKSRINTAMKALREVLVGRRLPHEL